jgi:hypothetical protein
MRNSHPHPDEWRGVTQARIADAIAMLERFGDRCHIPLFRALAEGRIVVVFVWRGASDAPPAMLARPPRPVVALILDDDGLNSGPAAFPAAAGVLRHTRALILHAAAGEAEHYEQAVAMAEAEGSCAVIECGTVHAEAWLDPARRAAGPRLRRSHVIWPRGGVHPIAPRKEGML